MLNSFSKYTKYVVLLIFIVKIISFGIPEYVKPIFIYEYFIFFGFSYLFAILQDFFNPSEKTDIYLRVAIIISSIVMLFTSIYYKATFSFTFSVIIFISFSYSLYLAIKQNKVYKQQD